MSVVSTKTGLALQIYAKTIAAVERKNVFKELCTVQTIMSGFSHRFNVMGTGIDTDVSSFALGSNPAETQLSVNKRDITVDRTLTSRKKIDNWEKKAANFDMVSAAVDQNATSMAIKIDKLVVAELNTAMGEAQLLAEDGSGKVVQDSAGEVTDTVIGTGTTAEAKGDALLEAMFAAGSVLEGKDQVGKQRYFVTSPTMYDKLVLSKKGVNADYNSGANGSIAEGNVLTIDGVQILKSNNLDTAPSNISVGTTLAGWFFTEDVIGITELIGLNTTEWEEKKEKCYYTDVEYAAGFGVLNPASLVAITY
jgi:ribosomal protein S8E